MKKGSEKMENIMESSLWSRLVSYLETGNWETVPGDWPFQGGMVQSQQLALQDFSLDLPPSNRDFLSKNRLILQWLVCWVTV